MADAGPPMEGIHYTQNTPQRLAEGVHLLPLFGNATCIDPGDGLVVVDTCARRRGPRLLEMIRALSDAPIRYVIYTHGHLDHAFGVPERLTARAKAEPSFIARSIFTNGAARAAAAARALAP
jgi:glyoxylase-like metal-dependent hydrolase (beta-lactamase superfamily II)